MKRLFDKFRGISVIKGPKTEKNGRCKGPNKNWGSQECS